MLFKNLADFRLGLRTGKAIHRLAVLEQHHSRQAANTEAGDNIRLSVAIDLGQQQLALIAFGDLLQQRHQDLAGRTPLGPEINEDRLIE